MRLIYQHSGNSVFRRDIFHVPLACDVTRQRPHCCTASFAGYICFSSTITVNQVWITQLRTVWAQMLVQGADRAVLGPPVTMVRV